MLAATTPIRRAPRHGPALLLALTLCALSGGCGREEPAPSPAATADQGQSGSSAALPDAATEAAATEAAERRAAETLNDVDREFATVAFGANIAEVQAGRLGAEKTLNEDVRQYAREMVKDHTAANEDLMRMAKAKALQLPTAPHADFKEALQRMNMVTGPQHDRFYMDQFGITGHERMVEVYEKEIREGQDADLKQFAERRLQTVKVHLEQARKIIHGVETTR